MRAIAVLLCLVLGLARASAEPNPDPAEETKKAASNFATNVHKAIQKIHTEHATPKPQHEMLRWAVEALFRRSNQGVPADLRGRFTSLENAGRDEVARLLHDSRARLGHREELKDGRDLALVLDAILHWLEPGATPEVRSRYIDPRDWRPCGGDARGHFYGLGLKLEIDPATKLLRVVTPVFNGPAHKVGIRAGDVITHVRLHNDRQGPLINPKRISTQGMTLEAAIELILGPEDTRVTLTVIPGHPARPKGT